MIPSVVVHRLLIAAAVAGPILGVVAARFASPHTGPVAARAAEADAEPLPPPRLHVDAIVDTPEQGRLRARIAETADDAIVSPFFIPKPVEEPVATTVAEPEAQADQESDLPTFTLTSIMRGKRTVASINGHIHQVGDRIAEGWSLESIDPEGAMVVIVHTKYGRRVVHLERRSDD